MARLRATKEQYAELERMCGNLRSIYLSNAQAEALVAQVYKKIDQIAKRQGWRFRLTAPKIWFRGYGDSGVSFGGKIHLSNNPSVYVVLHELAHELKGWINPVVPPPNSNHGIPEHHGVHYFKTLQFLRDMVRRYKVFKKFLTAEPPKPKPRRKSPPLVVLNDDGTFDVRIKPSVRGEIICGMMLDGCERDEFKWLTVQILGRQNERNVVKMDRGQLRDFESELRWLNVPEYEYALCRNIDKLNEACADALRDTVEETA